MRPTLERCNVIKVCDYFLSAGFSPFHKYASIGHRTSSNVINGQVHTRQVITNIQYQIVGVYWMIDSTPFVDWYFDVMKAQTSSAEVLLLAF
jgi:hypothetical protein